MRERGGRRRRVAFASLALVPILMVLGADSVLARLGAPALAARAVVDVTEFVVSAVAAVAFGRQAWRMHTSDRRPLADSVSLVTGWTLFAAACGSWSIGQAVWTLYEVFLQRETPTPSLADVGFLGFAGLAPAATLFVARGRLRPLSRVRAVLDGLIVAGALLVVSWMLILHQVLAAESAGLRLTISLAYPLGDVLVLSVVVVVISRTRLSTGLALLIGGAGLMALSDSAFIYLTSSSHFATGGITDAGWTSAFVLLAAAAGVKVPAGGSLRKTAGSWSGLFAPYVPLLACGSLLLAREIAGTADRQSLAGSGVLVLAVLARQGLLVLENHHLVRQLRVMAYTDPLTGIANRLGFTERLEDLVATRRPLAAAFCDLDSFKAVNDHCGHAVGDALLVAVASRLTGAVRDGDVVARLGGDEFAVLTSADSLEAAHDLRERLAEALASPFSLSPEVIAVMNSESDVRLLERVSVSLGVVSSVEVAGGSAEDVLHLADQRMYAAKRERASKRSPLPGVDESRARPRDQLGAG